MALIFMELVGSSTNLKDLTEMAAVSTSVKMCSFFSAV